MEEVGEAYVREEVLAPFGGTGPIRVQQERLTAQLIGDSKALQRAETPNSLPPIRVLGLAGFVPRTGDELVNAARDHEPF
jgi:hypothetical protein